MEALALERKAEQNRELRERFAKRGYEKAREEFEAARLTRKLEALYADLMEQGNA